jgi:hypothetical protein
MKKIIFITAIGILGMTSCRTVVNESSDQAEKALGRRVDSVLALMTVDEKIGQLNQ